MGEKSQLSSLSLLNNKTGEKDELAVNGAFIFVGLDPNTKFLADTAIQRDQWGFIVTGHTLVHSGKRPPGYETSEPTLLETSVPGIFAAGDVRSASTKQVASAAGEGATAALLVREWLRKI